MRHGLIVDAVLLTVAEVERYVRSTGRVIAVDGRDWREVPGAVVEFAPARLLATEDEGREVVKEIDVALEANGIEPVYPSFDLEADDFREHSRVLRSLVKSQEFTSRRVVSTLPSPYCPTAVQILRGRSTDEGEEVQVFGFMRSQCVMPTLVLDLVSFLWTAGCAIGADRVSGVRSVRVSIFVGSLHVPADERRSFP